MTQPLVDITDVFANAERISVSDLKVTDTLFSAFGDILPLKSVRTLKDGTVRTIREDGVCDYWESDKTITVIRG